MTVVQDAAAGSGAGPVAVVMAEGSVVTSRAYIAGALMPSVRALAGALRAIRGAGHTADVVGFAIPLAGEPVEGRVLERADAPVVKQRFDLMEFLAIAMDPHRTFTRFTRVAPGRNVPLAADVLGDITRWLVGIHTFKIHDVLGEQDVWVLARPNHAAAMHKVEGDSVEGHAGMLATLGVPLAFAGEYAARLAAGDCILTTCETDAGRWRRDQKIMAKHGGEARFAEPLSPVRYATGPG